MITVRSASGRNRLVVAASVAVVLITIVVTAALLLPDRTLAQAQAPDQAEPGPVRTSPAPPPPPALQLNPPTATPEPGAVEASAGPSIGSSDLEVVRFRPQVSLRRGESPPVIAAEKPAGAADSAMLKRPLAEAGSPQEVYQAPDIAGLLSPMEWTPLLYENFVGFSPPALGVSFSPWDGTSVWTVYDFSDDGFDRSWGANNWIYYYHEDDPSDNRSAWPAAAGPDALDPNLWLYPHNLNSWLDYGPIDLSNMSDVFVSFGLWYETEPAFDRIYFCASIDGYTYYCDYWSGVSGGWTDQAYWLTSYAGYSQVWLAWVFQSDFSIVDDGPFVDEIRVWGYDISATPSPTPTPDPTGELIQNGSFETGDLTHWLTETVSSLASVQRMVPFQAGDTPDRESKSPHLSDASKIEGTLDVASVGVSNRTAVDGQYAAYLWQPGGVGADFLYQTIAVPSDVVDVVLNFWFGVVTNELLPGYDWFCVSMSDPADHNDIWVDLGCADAINATGYWQQVLYALDDAELAAIAGKSTDLVFELWSDVDFYGLGMAGSGATTGWVDYVRVYATGGEAATSIDPNEPNDDPADAAGIACGQTITGTIGEAVGGYDVDWFELSSVPEGQIDIDIDADTQVPPSALDSVVYLYQEGDLDNWVAWNDDDGFSYDSYVTYTNTIADSTFYIRVKSYSGYGNPDSFYDLTVQCAGTGGGPPPAGSEQPPENPAAWTVMLYLNAEDSNFEDILTQYRTDIEAFIGSKSDFLNVAILYDGSGDGDTTRYLVQPNGNYTLGTNKWNLGERNMGHPDTLENFVSWAMDQYPAETYYLAVDDHGDGVYGISWDSTSNNDQLTPPELYSALKSATHNGDRKIDIFDYEACLMGLAENAYDLREWVDYVVFFEQISWGINTYPLYFSDLAEDDEPEDVGWRIIDRYYAEAIAANNGRGYPHTISLIDMSKMETVRDTVTSFGDAIKATDTQAQKDKINGARDNSQAFAADMDATNPMRAEYIDLWDLADEAGDSGLTSSQAAAVKSAVDAAVVHERHASGGASGYVWDHSGAHGLSIYYPPTKSSSAFDSYVAPSLYEMSRDGTWDEFLAWAVPSGNRRGMSASRSEIKLTGDDAFVFKYAYLPMVMRMK